MWWPASRSRPLRAGRRSSCTPGSAELNPAWRLAAGGATLGALGLIFGVLLEPGDTNGCTTGLVDGPYADAFLPAHLAAFAVLALLVATGDPRPLTYRVIAAMVLVIVVGLVWNPLLGVLAWVALALIVPATFAAAIAAAIMLVQIARARGEQRRAKEAELAQNLLWVIFAAGLPATAAGVYLNGVSLFCF